MLEAIQTQREQFLKDGASFKGNNAFIGYASVGNRAILNGQNYKRIGPGPCHGDLGNSSLRFAIVREEGNKLFILSQKQKLLVTEESDRLFFDYLVNRSPWKDVFLDKNYESVAKFGHVADTDLPSNLVISAMIASRASTESYNSGITDRLKIFHEITSLGFGENFAYIMSLVYGGDVEKKYKVSYLPISSGHIVFNFDQAQENYFRNFVNNTPQNLSPVSFLENGGYGNDGGVVNLWATRGGNAFSKWMSTLKPISAVKAVNHNIFHRAPSDKFIITSKEEFKDVLDQVFTRIFQ